jgi:hypothetical protein
VVTVVETTAAGAVATAGGEAATITAAGEAETTGAGEAAAMAAGGSPRSRGGRSNWSHDPRRSPRGLRRGQSLGVSGLLFQRELFGPAPHVADWASTGSLETARGALAAQETAATAAGMAAAGGTAGDGRTAMDGIVADTQRGIAAIAPSRDRRVLLRSSHHL